LSELLHPLETVTTIILMRHGHTEETEKGKLYNDPHVELTESGLAQARELGHWLKEQSPDVLLCSTAQRVVSTAKILEGAIGLPAQPIDGFNEWSVGDWEGRTYLDVKKNEPEAYKLWSSDPICHAPPGGESISDLFERIRNRLPAIIKENEGKKIALVTHAGVIRSIIVQALGMPIRNFWRISIPVGSASKIDFSENFATLHYLALLPLRFTDCAN